MKRLEHIDKLFEDQLSGMKVDPPADAWAQISGAMGAPAAKGKSKRKRIIAWLAISTSAAAILLYFLYIKSCDDPYRTEGRQLAQQEAEINEKPAQNLTTSPVGNIEEDIQPVQEDAPQAHTPTSQEDVQPSDKAPATPVITDPAVRNKQHTASESSAPVLSSPKADKTPSTIQKTVVDPTHQEKNTDKPEPALSVEKPELKKKATPKVEINIQPKEIEEDARLLAEQEQKEVEPAPTKIEQTSEVEGGTTEASEEIAEHTPEEVSTEAPALDSAQSQLNAPDMQTGLRFATGFSLQLYGGPSYHINNGPQDMVYTEGIYSKAPDNNITDFNLGFGARFHLNNLFVHSGVQLGSYGEKTSFNWSKFHTEHLRMDSTGNVVTEWEYIDYSTFVTPAGDTIVSYEAVIDTQYTVYSLHSIDTNYTTQHQQKANNRFRYVEIPIMIGYRYEYKSISIDVASGIGLAIPYAVSGYYLQDEQLQPMQNINIYENSVVNLLLSAGVHYHMNKNTSFSIMPMYRTNLTRLQRKDYYNPLDYQSLTLNVGLTRTF